MSEVDEEYEEGTEAGEEEEDEADPSEELVQLLEVQSNIEEDVKRLKALQKKGKLQGEVLAGELVSTVLPLLLSLSGAASEFAASSEEWAEGVDETLDMLESGLGGGGAAEQFTREELETFGWLFVRFQEFVSGMRQAGELPEETSKGLEEIDTKLNAALGTLRRVIESQEVQDDSKSEETTDRDSSGQEDADG